MDYESRCGRRQVTLDLAGVHLVDDDGMASMCMAHDRLHSAGGTLSVAGLRAKALHDGGCRCEFRADWAG